MKHGSSFHAVSATRRFGVRKSWPLYLAAGACGAFALALSWWWYGNYGKPQVCQEGHDLVIRNGMVLDGLGHAPFRADIGIRDGRITCIGSIKTTPGEHVINATGQLIAPGFIDVHTHVERNLPEDTKPFLAPNFIRQGITTIITGNCGSSTLAVRAMLDQLDNKGSQVNVATFVGHNSIRRRVMKRANRAPTPDEMQEMQKFLAKAMDDGALGLSTGLAYIPGAYAQKEEIIELAQSVAHEGGLYVSHIRDEGVQGFSAVKEALEIGGKAGLPVHISHFKASGKSQWGAAKQRLALVDDALRQGQRVTIDQYPYTASSTSLEVLLPSWALAEDSAEVNKRLRDPQMRARVRSEMIAQLHKSGWRDYSFARIAYCSSNLSLNGLSIPQVAATRMKSSPEKQPTPAALSMHGHEHSLGDYLQKINTANGDDDNAKYQADVILDLIVKGGAQMIYFDMNDQDLTAIMQHPDTMFGSDSSVRSENTQAVPHPRGMGTFPRVLSHYVRETRTLSLEEAVRRMTSLSARTFGIRERGQISEGYWADLVIFYEQSIADKATYERPLAAPAGIPYVIVNGKIVLENNHFTKAVPGKAIRHQ